jgi:hypothetical protein
MVEDSPPDAELIRNALQGKNLANEVVIKSDVAVKTIPVVTRRRTERVAV